MSPISSGLAKRPSGIASLSALSFFGSSTVDRLIGVSTAPGPTPTTWMSCGPSSTPAVRVSIRIPPLDAIGRVARHRPVLVDRADVDDPPAGALGDHLLGGELRAEEGALEIDRQDLVVLVFGGLEHRSARLDA